MEIACDNGAPPKTLPSCPKIVRFAPNNGDTVAVVVDEPGKILIRENFSWSTVRLSDDVFDMDFFPGFDPLVNESKTMIVSSRNRPIQLLRLSDQSILSAYTAYSFTEEIVHPLSVKFEPTSCATIIGGFPSSTVRVWDVQRPGRHIRDLVFSTRKGADGQSIKGIVSAVNYWNPDTILAGTYSKKIGMFDIRDKDKGMILGQFAKMGGIVQIESIPSRNAVVTNHRNDSYSIRIWDVRNPERPVQELSRNFSNHQRSSFGVFKDKFVVAGDIDGNLHVFDLISGECVMTRAVSPGTPTVSVDVNDFGKVAVGCGARVFDPVGDSSDESDGGNSPSYRVEFFNLS